MSIAEVPSLEQMVSPITNGKSMKSLGSDGVLTMVVLSICALVTACSSQLPVGEIATSEARAKTMAVVRDREQELAALRAEMAATKIASAKKEAELQELRDLVQQLRLENAESRQAYLEMRERAEQRQKEEARIQDEQERAVQFQTTQQLTVLKDTVVVLVQEVSQLREDVARSMEKEPAKLSRSSSDQSIAPGPKGVRPDEPKGRSPMSKDARSTSTIVPTVLMTHPSSVTVQPGETLQSLAKQHHTSVALLQTLNHLNGESLQVGQVLILPSPTQP